MTKQILITGSTDGIGKLAATRLAEAGYSIYLHGRNQLKVADTCKAIIKQTQNQNVHSFVADFSDLQSVKEMAQRINNKLDKIDVLINNAGVFESPTEQNRDGLDIRIVVNYLAPYLLTKELMPMLRKGTAARIINLSSAAQAPISYETFNGGAVISSNESYAQSKLALTMWSFYLAAQQKDIAVIAVNPGSLLNTKMANEAYGQYWSPAEKGSDLLYQLAVSQEHAGISGKYFDNDKGMYARAHPHAYDNIEIERLITATEKLI